MWRHFPPMWKSLKDNTQQTRSREESRSSPLRFVWMQNNKFRQTVVDPCDQATWLLGQASGAHSTVPPQINSLHRIQREGERKGWGEVGGQRGGEGVCCMWMVRTSTIRKSEVGSFLRLCRELTLPETPPLLFSLFVFFSSFSLTIGCKLPEG